MNNNINNSMKNIPELDGFRFFAIMLVMSYHYGIYVGAKYFDVIVGTGWIGVPLFFIMSGFLISLPYIIKAYEFEVLPSIKTFYKKRIIRIFPLYYFSLAIFVMIQYVFHYSDNIQLSGIVQHVFFLQNIFTENLHINSVYWSLAVEIHFYIVFPIIAFFLHKFLKERNTFKVILLLLGIMLISFMYRLYVCTSMDIANQAVYMKYIYCSTIANFESFIFGISAAILFVFILRKPNFIITVGKQILMLLILLVPLYFMMLYASENGVGHLHMDKYAPVFFYTGINTILALLVLVVLSTYETIVNKFLSLKIFVFISILSYSLYIWHLPIYDWIRFNIITYLNHKPTPIIHLGEVMVCLSLSLLISYLTYRFIEKPFFKRKEIGV